MNKENGKGIVPWLDGKEWSNWKITLAVVVFCAAFWSGVAYLAVKFFG